MTAFTARLRTIPSWQITLGAALLVLGFLIAAQLAAEGPRVRYTTQERSPLVETALGLQAQQDDLKARIVALRSSIQEIEQQGAGSAGRRPRPQRPARGARIAAGLIPLTGTGIVLQLEDSTQPVAPGGNESDYLVGAADLRTVVALLWRVGAEAIAINGERMTGATAIIDIGGSILVNAAYLAGPYQVTALGPTDLFTRLSATPGWEEFVRTRRGSFGIGISWAEPEIVDIPAYAGSVNLRESRAVEPGRRPSVSRRARREAGDARPTSQLTITAVAFVLGLLVVVQLRGQAGGSLLATLSSQDLTILVANVNTGNDRLRSEVRPSRDSSTDLRAQPGDRGDVGGPAECGPGPDPGMVRPRSGGRPGHPDLVSGGSTPARSATSSTSCATRAPKRSRSRTSGSSPGPRSVGVPGHSTSMVCSCAIRSRFGQSAARKAGGVPDPRRRDHRPAGGDESRRDGRGPADRQAHDPAGDPARSRSGSWSARAFDTLRPMTDRPVLALYLGDCSTAPAHPCGGDTWLVDRLGADIGLRCQTCAAPCPRRAAGRSSAGSSTSFGAATRP